MRSGRKCCRVDALTFKDSRSTRERSEAMEQTGRRDALVSWRIVRALRCCRVFEFEFMVVDGLWSRALCARCRDRDRTEGAVHLHHFDRRRAHAGGPCCRCSRCQDDCDDRGLAEAKLPFISVLADPTMGGVSASFAFMGTLIAEPKALIGFADRASSSRPSARNCRKASSAPSS